ncbi:MAG: hypothetical protein Q7J98_05115 [Kiritimatiellia bacterium]|nr:hypothetical protein [Kiritimatiellia bacterium]
MILDKRYRNKRRLSQDDLASLGVQAESLEAEVNGLEQFVATLDTPAWQGIVRFLSGRLIEIEHARSSVAVEETIKHAQIQGQVNEIRELAGQIENAKKILSEKMDALSDVRARMAPTEK